MSKRKNVKTIILTLTLFISTLSFCNASAMEVNQIDNNTYKKEEKINDNLNNKEKETTKEKEKAQEKYESEIIDTIKPFKYNFFQQKNEEYKKIMENIIKSYLKTDFLKYEIEDYEIHLKIFLEQYKANGVLKEDYLNHLLRTQKSKIEYDICLDNKKKFDKQKFIQIIKNYINSHIGINCFKINFTISEYYEKKLEEYFNKHRKTVDDLLEQFQIKYDEITKEIEKNKKNIEEITPEMIEQFKKKLIQRISFYKNVTIEYLELQVKKGLAFGQTLIDNISNASKEILLNHISLTANNKLNKNNFIKALKHFEIINSNSNYIINKKEELNLLIFLRKYKTKIEKESSRESVNELLLKKSPLLKKTLKICNDNNETSLLFMPSVTG